MPCGTVDPKTSRRATIGSTCSGLKSPESSANALRSVGEMTISLPEISARCDANISAWPLTSASAGPEAAFAQTLFDVTLCVWL
jgi:hypothetical protein